MLASASSSRCSFLCWNMLPRCVEDRCGCSLVALDASSKTAVRRPACMPARLLVRFYRQPATFPERSPHVNRQPGRAPLPLDAQTCRGGCSASKGPQPPCPGLCRFRRCRQGWRGLERSIRFRCRQLRAEESIRAATAPHAPPPLPAAPVLPGAATAAAAASVSGVLLPLFLNAWWYNQPHTQAQPALRQQPMH